MQVFRFGSFYLLVRALPKYDFGVWTLFVVIATVYEYVRMSVIQQGLVRYLAASEDPAHRARINTASLLLHLVYTLVGTLLLGLLGRYAGAIWEMPELGGLLYQYLLVSVLLLPFLHFNILQQANFQFGGILLSSVVRQGLFFAAVLYHYVQGSWTWTLADLVWIQVYSAALASVVSWLASWPWLQFSRHLDPVWLGRLFTYSVFVAGTSLSAMLIKNLDQLFLGIWARADRLAGYGTSVRIAYLVEVPSQAMAAVLFPQSAYRMAREGEEAISYLYEKSVGIILALIVPALLLVFIFPGQVLHIVAGDRYLDMAPVLRITLLGALFVPFARQISTILDACGRPDQHFYLSAGTALAGVAIHYVLIRQGEVVGAAWSMVLTQAIFFVAGNTLLYHYLGVRPLRIFMHTGGVYSNGFRLLWRYVRSLWVRR
ncbi:MAG: hypothetical protein OHK0039_05580 [Bacteroidia bacterium]